MDLVSAKAAGVSFFTYKATEGTSTKHIHYGEALKRARDAGIEFLGAYIVPRTPGPSVSAQVDYFLSYVDAQTPWWRQWPGWFFQVDTEHWSYDAVSPDTGEQVCQALRDRTGRWVIHYAPKWAYGNTIPGTTPLWASDYGSNPVAELKAAYPGDQSSRWSSYSGRVPTFLQYGSQLTIGTQPGCDGNAYRGTVDQLRQLITGHFAQPQEGDAPMHMVVANRPAPDAGGTVYAIFTDHITNSKMLAVPMSNFARVQAWQASGVRYIDLGMAKLDPAFFNIVATDAYPAPCSDDGKPTPLPPHTHDLPPAKTGGVSPTPSTAAQE